MNTPVSYSMAKLLDSKEVRFENWQGKIFVDGEEQPHMASWYVGAKEILIRPTIADVVMWLYEKHGIWISVSITIQKEYYYQCIEPLLLEDVTKHYKIMVCMIMSYHIYKFNLNCC